MKILRICCLLCALTGGGPEAFASAPEPASDADLAAPRASSAGEDGYIRAEPAALWTLHSLNIAAAGMLSSIIPGLKEELKRFAGGKQARTWDLLGRAATDEMMAAFGAGGTVGF